MQIELQGIHKRFGSVHALKGIDLKVEAGTIHGLVGENGAGKSTLMKILTGYLSRSSGRILLDGEAVEYSSPSQAAAHGIGMLYQEPQDFPPLSVLENFMVGREGHRQAKRDKQRERLLSLAGEAHFDLRPEQRVEKLTVGERQQLELLRLLGRNARILILDEPTTGISERQKTRLFEALRQIRDQGRTILLVSHKLDEVESLCDRVAILRQGELVGEEDAPFHIPRLLQLMFDTTPGAMEARRQHAPGEALLSFNAVSASGERTGLKDCSLELYRGEIVGLAGLAGSGQGVFLRLAAALQRPSSGQISFHGDRLTGTDHGSFRASGGAFLPANRLDEGLIAGFTIRDHFALANASSSARAATEASAAIQRFRIRGTPDTPVQTLSGGNQQRLQLALIPASADLILLENPTRGLDVESARWVWSHLRRQYAVRGSLVFSSAELDEILEVADRVLVFFDGRVVRDLRGEAIDQQQIAAAMTGN